MSIENKIKEHRAGLISLIDILTIVYLVSVYIFAGGHEHWVQSYSNLIALFYIFFLGCYAYLHRDNLLSVYAKLYMPFLILCAVSFFWTWDRPYCLKMTAELGAMFILSVLMYNYLVTENKTDLFLYGLYIGGICLMFGTILYFGIPEYFRGLLNGKRMGHILGNLNDEGIHSAYSALIALYFTIYRKRYFNIIPAMMLMSFASGTGSRKVVVLLIFGIFLLVFLMKGRKAKIYAFCSIACIVLIYLFVPLFEGIKERFIEMTGAVSGETDGSTSIRIEMVKQAFIQFRKTPLFGIGLGSSHVLLSQTLDFDSYSHNNYAELLIILGSFGLVFWYAHYLFTVNTLVKAVFKHNGMAILSFVFLVLGLVVHVGAVEYQERFQILVVMYFYCCRYKLNSDEKNIHG